MNDNNLKTFFKITLALFFVLTLAGASYVIAFTGPGGLSAGSGSGALSASSSNVGIGTTTPSTALHVVGTGIRSVNGTSDSYVGVNTPLHPYPGIWTAVSDNLTSYFLGLNAEAGNSWLELGNYTPLNIGRYGSVAINVDSYANGYSTTITTNNASRIPLIAKGASSQTADIFNVQNSAGTALMNVTAGGNVGIGTTTPAQKLVVNGNVQATSFIGTFSGAVAADNVASGAFGALQGGGNYSFPASVGIGIGTTTPVSALSVGGAGISGAGIYGYGTTYGIYGLGNSNATGIYGLGGNGGSATGYGIYGLGGNGINGIGGAAGTDGSIGIYGRGGTGGSGTGGNGLGGTGVYGIGEANSTSTGVYGGGTYGVSASGTLADVFAMAKGVMFPDRTIQTTAGAGILTGTSASIGGSSLETATCAATTTAITGATTGMVVDVTPVTYPGNRFLWRGYVSASDTVKTLVCNYYGLASTPTSSTYNIRVIK